MATQEVKAYRFVLRRKHPRPRQKKIFIDEVFITDKNPLVHMLWHVYHMPKAWRKIAHELCVDITPI